MTAIHFIIGQVAEISDAGVTFQSESDFTREVDADLLQLYMLKHDPLFQGTIEAIQEALDRGCDTLVQERRSDGWQFHLVQGQFIQPEYPDGAAASRYTPVTRTLQ